MNVHRKCGSFAPRSRLWTFGFQQGFELITSTGLVPHDLNALIDTGVSCSPRLPKNDFLDPLVRLCRKAGAEHDRLLS